jgi:hypothetical protein
MFVFSPSRSGKGGGQFGLFILPCSVFLALLVAGANILVFIAGTFTDLAFLPALVWFSCLYLLPALTLKGIYCDALRNLLFLHIYGPSEITI